MPTHSRTSSSASSVGSSYVSSTDSNKTSHIESPTPLQSQSLEIANNANFHAISGTPTTIPSYQNAYKLINEHLNNQNGHKNNNNNEHEDGSDTDQTDFNNLHHESSSIKCNKLIVSIDQMVHETNGKPIDFMNGTIEPTDEQTVCGENFAYKTLNGDVIRSVHAPGKGKAINYKVSVLLHCVTASYLIIVCGNMSIERIFSYVEKQLQQIL